MIRRAMSNAVIHLAEKEGVKLSMHRLMRHSSMQITMDFDASVDDVLHDAVRQLDQPSP
jgi:hypothetical protein